MDTPEEEKVFSYLEEIHSTYVQECAHMSFCILTVLPDTSTTRLARAEDVKKPPKATGKGKHSTPLPTHWPSNPMDKQGLPRGARVVSPTTVRQGPRILQIRKQRNDPKGWNFFVTKHRACSSNRAEPGQTIEDQ